MASSYRVSKIFPENLDELINCAKEFKVKDLRPYHGQYCFINRLDKGMSFPSEEGEDSYTRSFLFQQPYKGTGRNLYEMNTGKKLESYNIEDKKLFLISAELPNQYADGAMNLDLLGIYNDKLAFIECKQGKNSENVFESIAKCLDYTINYYNPKYFDSDNRSKLNEKGFQETFKYFSNIPDYKNLWPYNQKNTDHPDQTVYIIIMADNEWWNINHTVNNGNIKTNVQLFKEIIPQWESCLPKNYFKNNPILLGLNVQNWQHNWNDTKMPVITLI